jgi:hypothetical protein
MNPRRERAVRDLTDRREVEAAVALGRVVSALVKSIDELGAATTALEVTVGRPVAVLRAVRAPLLEALKAVPQLAVDCLQVRKDAA